MQMQMIRLFVATMIILTAVGAATAEQPPAAPVQPYTGAVEQPAPLDAGAALPVQGRNPFSAPPKKRLSTAGYGKVVEGCQLRGIIKVSGRHVGLFAVHGEGGKKKGGEDELLRRVRVGEKIRVMTKDEEHVLTVRELGERSAVIVGENNQEYKVWL